MSDPSQDPERRRASQLEIPFSASARPEKYMKVERKKFSSGMERDVDSNKVMYDLVFDGPMLERYARHLTQGATRYSPRNWMRANSKEELERFKSSATRHFFQWLRGDKDEDHAAAVMFNLNGFEYVKEKMANENGD